MHRNGKTGFELYDLNSDISEKENLASDYPEIVQKLGKYMEAFDREMNDSSMIRPHGVVE